MNGSARVLTALVLVAALAVPAAGLADDGKDAPQAGAVSVSDVTADSARVTGTLRLGKGAAAYWLEYWSDASVARSPAATATHEEDDKDHRVVAARTLSGLTPGTAYTVRLVASSDKGRSTGPATAFTTVSAPPSTDPTPDTPRPPSAPDAPQEGAPQPPVGPALGASFIAQADRGSVRVRLPGSDRFVDLPQAASVPVGTVVDARGAGITLSTELPDGSVQQGTFGGGRFEVRQAAGGDGTTDLHLRGRGLRSCGARSIAAATARKKPRAKRRMWGKDRSGRFRTFGRDSVTTVRGTAWSVADRCDGTVTRVTEGAVDVRVRRTGRVVRVAAGERFLARHRR